jgi:hypothetical protein
MSILRSRPPSAKPDPIRLTIAGTAFHATQLDPATLGGAGRAFHLQPLRGRRWEAVAVLVHGGQVLCSCLLGRPRGACKHVDALVTAGMITRELFAPPRLVRTPATAERFLEQD